LRVDRGTPRWELAAFVVALTLLAACGGGTRDNAARTGGSIDVAIVDTPNTQDLARLTPSLFTARTHIKVNYTILDEGTLRELITGAVPLRHNRFDAVMIGPYEAPQFGRDGYIVDLTQRAAADRDYAEDDLIPSVRRALSAGGRLYASPFYGESSFLMYRKDVLAATGITMPAHPTWTQVAAIARRIDTPERAGICMRGKPGWGELGAPLTTVINTFGATWWSATPDGDVDRAQVDRPAFRRALEFYVDLARDAGQPGVAKASYNGCLEQYLAGKAAMWYDATVAAGQLEASDSAVKGKNGYAPAPVERTGASGWLWSWALAIPSASRKVDEAWSYIAWATGPQYIKEAGPRIPGGWAAIPPGTRRSTYALPQYRRAGRAFVQPTLAAIESAPIDAPGTTPRPGNPGISFVGIPEFQDVGDQCTAQFSAVIRGAASIDAALANCQQVAARVER
jgi:sorbitol/mannitol transport system substrate-binding protein